MKIVEIIKPHLEKGRYSHLKKPAIIGGAVLVFLLLSYSVFAYYQQVNREICEDMDCVTIISPAPSGAVPSAAPTTQPVLTASYLDGTQVEAGTENLHPLAVMIENHPEARPQSGLSQASLVYEAIAEGGITRFMAVFGNPTLPIKVGPVRSARSYFVEFANEIKAFYAHVGGSADALNLIRNTGVLDLDQFAVGSAAFRRELKGGVALEHTMYSSTDLLWKYATETKRWSKTGDYQPWLFQPDILPEQRPTSVNPVIIQFSSSNTYRVSWSYDQASNSYLRSMAGSAHKDANTGTQISAKNIVLQTVTRKMITSGGKEVWDFNLSGTGKAVIVQNGTHIIGTWKKEGNSRTRYYDSAGKEVTFVAGPTWVELVHPDTPVSY